MDEQKIIDLITEWLIAARESPDNSDASLRLSAKTVYYEILRHVKHSDDLSEIRVALGLPADTPEPLVGVIWSLQQQIEALEHMIRGPFPLAGLPNVDEPEKSIHYCKEHFGGVYCDRVKGHIGHHWGLWRTNPDRRVEWRYEDDGTT